MKKTLESSRQVFHHFTCFDQANQLVEADKEDSALQPN